MRSLPGTGTAASICIHGEGDSVLTAILVASIAVANPVESFVRENPAARLIRSADGSSLVHASGFLAETGAARPEEAARAFLRSHGAAFGIANDQALVRKGAPPVAGAAAIRFERTFQGLPVFGADLVVGVDAQNRIFLVNSGNVAPATWDRHLLGEAQALGAAVSSFAGGARDVEAVSVTAGWKAVAGALHAVYRVDFVARQPAGDWRVFVDAQTGRALFRAPLRSSVNGNVYPVSPAETADALCPLASGKPSICAPTVSIAFPNLSSGTDLGSSQTTVYNCKGADAPTSSAGIPGLCSSVAPLPANGGFGFSADSTFQLNSDDFSAAMAYFHLDKHLAFFKKLDPNLPSGASGRALTGSLPALVNVQEGGKAFENAFYSPLIDAMVFGQGAHADYAYDATVMYHESTHAVVSAWGGFDIGIDAQGGLDEPGAVNEGTADSMAVSETGRSEIGSFLSAVNPSPLPSGRELDDPGVLRSCQGSGTQVTILGGLNALNGLDGEVHDDGEIWNGFYWEVFRGHRADAQRLLADVQVRRLGTLSVRSQGGGLRRLRCPAPPDGPVRSHGDRLCGGAEAPVRPSPLLAVPDRRPGDGRMAVQRLQPERHADDGVCAERLARPAFRDRSHDARCDGDEGRKQSLHPGLLGGRGHVLPDHRRDLVLAL